MRDQILRADRGRNLCSQACSLSPSFCPSIHPKQSATSSASAWVTDRVPEPFFPSRSHTPCELPWFAANQASQSEGLAKSLISFSELVRCGFVLPLCDICFASVDERVAPRRL